MTHNDNRPAGADEHADAEALTPAEQTSRMLRAAVAADAAEWEAAQRFLEQSDEQRRRRRHGRGSVVFALRLDPREVEALERRAYAVGNKPSVVARNLIRAGLSRPVDLALTRLADDAEDLVTRLRQAASGPAPPPR